MYWIIIPLVAVLGSFFLRYQKMKMKQLKQGTHQDLEDMETLINSLKKRIENLEAIVTEPDEDEIPRGMEADIGKTGSDKTTSNRKKSRGGTIDNMLNKK
jgi:Na+/phosphate symporter